MEASFIIPVYNHLDLTLACLKSLEETVGAIDYEVILVNDGSEPETTAGLRQLAGGRVRLIENPGNQGFAHSNNRGALEAKGEYLFLVNNDLVFLPGWYAPMRDAFRRVKRLGLVGNVQLNAATGEIDHAGAYVSLKGTIAHKKSADRRLLSTPAYSRTHIVTGACCAIPRSLYQHLGGFDEAFVNGGEDVDFCFRLGAAGFRIAVANKSIVRHHVSATRKEPNINDERNSRLLQRRWDDRLASLAAAKWPDHFLRQARSTRRWEAVDKHLLFEALSRFLLLKKGPAPAALNNAFCEQERNERHWKSLLEGWTDDMIKDHERQAHARPLLDKFEYDGLSTFSDTPGVWIREFATIKIPRGSLISSVGITGYLYEENEHMPVEKGELGLAIKVNEAAVSSRFPLPSGDFQVDFEDVPARAANVTEIQIKLLGVQRSNAFAFIGRKLARAKFIPAKVRNYFEQFRAQRLNKRLSINSIQINGEDVFNFAKDATNPLNTEYALRHAKLGINLVGWFKAELGIGESARLAAKALAASNLPYSIVPLKVNCLASQGDSSLDAQFSAKNPHPINVFHIDAPQCPDIDHHHGSSFRKDRYNIAYWAWELPDFPDNWTQHFKYFDEIWTPSHFVREAISIKSPLPVIRVPHCIQFSVPERDYRSELGLPSDKFLFSFAYDLNSYQERKNPKAAIEAFRLAFADSDRKNDVGLVIKTQSSQRNQESLQQLKALLDGLPNVYLIDRTLSREMTYGLMKACDSYLSLHRSEGFGLTVAESMYLGKPVISTNWSATSEFVNASNGCPVNYQLIKLEKNHGPYKKGQLWADPDPEHAATYMTRLVNDSEYAKTLGANARKRIEDEFSPTSVAETYRKRLRSIALW